MKPNRLIYLLIPIICLCFMMSCHEDNDDTLPPENEAVITTYNYLYEGDIFRFYLETEITKLEEDITTWEQIGPNDPGYNEAQENITIAEATIESHNSSIESIVAIGTVPGFPPGGVPPNPPPQPCICIPVPLTFQHLLTLEDTSITSATLYNDNEVVLAGITPEGNSTSAPNYDNTIFYNTIDFASQEFLGTGRIVIEKTWNNEPYTYEVDFSSYNPN